MKNSFFDLYLCLYLFRYFFKILCQSILCIVANHKVEVTFFTPIILARDIRAKSNPGKNLDHLGKLIV